MPYKSFRHNHSALCAAIISLLILAVSLWPSRSSEAEKNQTQSTRLKFAALDSLSTPEETEFVLEAAALFRILDEEFLEDSLQTAADLEQLQSRIDGWSSANPELWRVAQERLTLCRELQQLGLLGSTFTADVPDARWLLLITNGQPISESVIPLRGDEACSLWTYTWEATDSCRQGLEISCRSLPELSYPAQIIEEDPSGFVSARAIWPAVAAAQFPAANGTRDLWFSVWIKGSELTRPTLDASLLTMTVNLYDSSRSELLQSRATVTNIQTMRGVLEATAVSDRQLVRAMSYCEFAGVSPGVYSAQIIVSGAHANDGEVWLDLDASGERRISDLLLLHQSVSRDDNMLPGIVRAGRSAIYDNPEATFAPGAWLHLYAEADIAGVRGKDYEVTVTLLPLAANARRGKSVVSTGKAIVVADSLDQPTGGDKWQSPRSQETLDSLAKLQTEGDAAKMFARRLKAESDSLTVEIALRLDKKLKTSKYLLTLTLTDPVQRRFFLSTRRVIQVVKPGSYLHKI